MNSLNIKKIENSVTWVKYPETSMNECTFPNFTYMDIGYIGYTKDILTVYLDILNIC